MSSEREWFCFLYNASTSLSHWSGPQYEHIRGSTPDKWKKIGCRCTLYDFYLYLFVHQVDPKMVQTALLDLPVFQLDTVEGFPASSTKIKLRRIHHNELSIKELWAFITNYYQIFKQMVAFFWKDPQFSVQNRNKAPYMSARSKAYIISSNGKHWCERSFTISVPMQGFLTNPLLPCCSYKPTDRREIWKRVN